MEPKIINNNQWNQNNNNNQWNQGGNTWDQGNNNQWNQGNNNQWNQAPQSAAAAPAAGNGGNCAGLWAQCGGNGFSGPSCCSEGSCKMINEYYSQCQ